MVSCVMMIWMVGTGWVVYIEVLGDGNCGVTMEGVEISG